jgi:sulfane dehydrogenase subunit SoxC
MPTETSTMHVSDFGGRIKRAPEGFLDDQQIRAVQSGRREFLRNALLAAGAATGAPALAQGQGEKLILEPQPQATSLGQPVAVTGYGMPSKHERNLMRRESPGLTRVGAASVSFSPLQGMFGIITASGLHFERHHQGWHDLDPSGHRLMINGSDDRLVKRPSIFTIDDLMRMPSVSRMHFIECGANTGMEWGNVAVPTVQYSHGMLSCSEFTGVRLRDVLDYCGADYKRGRFVLAEGGDGSGLTRTIPMELIESGEVLLCYGMNGEMLRPENGYPLRLVVPGVQGVSWVKWLRRIEVGDAPYGAREEVMHYVDMMPDGTHRQYTSIQECKSVITTPSGGQTLLDKGSYNLTGLAWSGRGKVRRVDVSFDGGRNWKTATLQTPVLSKCLTRFSIPWTWKGEAAILQSRAIDDTGYVQPQMRQLRAVRGTRSIYHNNAIQSWKVEASGEVSNVQV